ncbi:MAG: hypothetical protein NTW86_26070 [Candidatus Sumerlaeota bacterium]|nr:hypothetical protein [Candidatus Sumerlaeota bacterium]
MKTRIKRYVWGVVVAGFWLAMMGSLVLGHLMPSRKTEPGDALTPSELIRDWKDVEEWMEVLSRGHRIGVACLTVRKEKDGGGFRLDSRSALDLGLPPGARVTMAAAALMNSKFELDRFIARIGAAGKLFELSGFALGDRLYLKFSTGGDRTRRAYWPLAGPISFLEAARPLAARRIDLAEGAEYRLEAFDPIWFGGAGEARLKVGATETIDLGGRPVEATRVETTFGGRKAVAWVDADRSIVKYQVSETLTLQRIGRDEAQRVKGDFPAEAAPPRFDIDEYAHNLEMIDLSQGNPFAALAGILFELTAPKP